MTFINRLKGYRLVFQPSFFKDLKAIPIKDAQAITRKVYALVAGDTNLDIKKLEGYLNRYRIRHGVYRIVYDVEHKEIIVSVVAVNHRSAVYKRSARR